MELRSNTSVLRSNAPALPGGIDSPKGVLQVSSGNVGSSNFDLAFGSSKGASYDEYEDHVPSLSAIPRCRSAQATLKLQRRKQRRERDGELESGDTYPMYTQIITQAERLSPRYQTYRNKQRKTFVEGSNHEQKWPDELEEIFQQALRVIPNWGRKKRTLDGKLCGRNEWISRYIWIHSGVWRDRKQVSSHIQVLKPFLEDNPIWMKFVTDTDSNAEPGFRSSIDFQSPILTEAQLMQPLKPLGILGSNVAPELSCLRQIEFEMYVLDPRNNPIHSYTSIQSDIGSVPRNLEDVSAWHSTYPDLEFDYHKPQQNGEVILFEADFRLMDNHPTPGSKLGVDFFVTITRGIEFKDWNYATKFYENRVPVKSGENGYLPEDPDNATLVDGVSGVLKHSEVPLTTDVRLEIAFRSSWWVSVFFNMTNKRLKVAEETKGDSNTLKQEEERANRYLQDMSVMQEVWATRNGTSTRQRMCVFLWKFRLGNGGTPTTTWRKLNLPIAEVKAESPYVSPKPIYQPSMNLDTALQFTTCPQPNPLYAEHFDHNANNLFAENSERLLAAPPSESNSPLSTPTASQPSFTDPTHYGQIASSSTLPPYASQPSTYHSQDFGYPSQSSTASSQDSIDPPDDYAFSSQESGYISQDAIFDDTLTDPSQEDLYYASQPDLAYYGRDPTSNYEEALYTAAEQAQHHDQLDQDTRILDANAHHDDRAPISHTDTLDFDGGQIHLSFTESHEHGPPAMEYDSPYVVDATADGAESQQFEHQHQKLEDQELEYYQLPQQDYAHPQHELMHEEDALNLHLHHPVPQHDHQHHLHPFDPEQWNPSLWSNTQFQSIEFAEMGEAGDDVKVLGEGQRVLEEVVEMAEVGDAGDGQEEGEGDGLKECPNLVEQGAGRAVVEESEMEGTRFC